VSFATQRYKVSEVEVVSLNKVVTQQCAEAGDVRFLSVDETRHSLHFYLASPCRCVPSVLWEVGTERICSPKYSSWIVGHLPFSELERIGKEVVVTYLKALFRLSPEGSHVGCRDGRCPD